MTTWLLATSNPGKVADWQGLLTPHGIDGRALPNLEQVEEHGADCREIAEAKALAIRGRGRVLGDDVGLWVDAMDGAPGLELKGWALSLGGWPQARSALGALAGSPAEFRIGVALAEDGVLVHSILATTPGRLCTPVADNPGVEPCFWPDGASAPLPLLRGAEWEQHHYRAVALRALLDGL